MTRFGDSSMSMMEMTRCPSTVSDNSVMATPLGPSGNKTTIFNKTGTDLMDETCASGLLGNNVASHDDSEFSGQTKMSTTDFLRALSKDDDDDESLSEEPVKPPNSGFLQALVIHIRLH